MRLSCEVPLDQFRALGYSSWKGFYVRGPVRGEESPLRHSSAQVIIAAASKLDALFTDVRSAVNALQKAELAVSRYEVFMARVNSAKGRSK